MLPRRLISEHYEIIQASSRYGWVKLHVRPITTVMKAPDSQRQVNAPRWAYNATGVMPWGVGGHDTSSSIYRIHAAFRGACNATGWLTGSPVNQRQVNDPGGRIIILLFNIYISLELDWGDVTSTTVQWTLRDYPSILVVVREPGGLFS